MRRLLARIAMTLLELIVVVAILAIVVCLLLPAVQQVRQAAVRLQSADQIKQITLGMHNYCTSNNGKLPPSRDPYAVMGDDVGTSPLYSVRAYIEDEVSDLEIEKIRDKEPRSTWRWRRKFFSPADPTLRYLRDDINNHVASYVSSYSANMMLFGERLI